MAPEDNPQASDAHAECRSEIERLRAERQHYVDAHASVKGGLVELRNERDRLRAEIESLKLLPETVAAFGELSTLKRTLEERDQLKHRVRILELAIVHHRSQKADDRCIEDDDRLYAALGDGIKCDRRVGSKKAMLANCARFIDRRCEGGKWPSYVELESEIERLRAVVQSKHDYGPASSGEQENAWRLHCATYGWDPTQHPAAKDAFCSGYLLGDSFSMANDDGAIGILRASNERLLAWAKAERELSKEWAHDRAETPSVVRAVNAALAAEHQCVAHGDTK